MSLINVHQLPHSEPVTCTAGEIANALGVVYSEGLHKGYTNGLTRGLVITLSAVVTGAALSVALHIYTDHVEKKKI